MDKVLTLEVEFISFIPVSPNCKNLTRTLLHGDDVGQGNACNFAILVGVFVAFQIDVYMHFQNAVAIILNGGHALFFGLLLLNVVQLVGWITQLDIAVETSLFELGYLILGLAHYMCNTLRSLQTGRAVGHDDVFCGDKHGHLTAFAWVKVDLLEG